MKAISLWQPWATLVAVGAKHIETRSWGTRYRGPVAIHAARTTVQLNALRECPHFHAVLASGVIGFPLGEIIATAHLADVWRVERLERAHRNRNTELDSGIAETLRFWGHDEDTIRRSLHRWDLTDQERAFGDYSAGRFGWLLDDVVKLDRPIPFRGKQGLFDVPDHLLTGATP